MGIVRAALEEMACHYDARHRPWHGEVMDRAFQRFDGPFRHLRGEPGRLRPGQLCAAAGERALRGG